jgi:hypothetical protein
MRLKSFYSASSQRSGLGCIAAILLITGCYLISN